MTRVVQAAGRLIRSADDIGVIALLDRRFLDRPYVDRLPADWLAGGEAAALGGDLATAAREFFASASSASDPVGVAPGGPVAPRRRRPAGRKKG
jgi:hypothetical protein